MEKEINETIKTYNKIAVQYSSFYSSLEPIQEVIDFFIENVGGKNILDVGCASGRDAKYFFEHGFNVTGIDLSEKFIELAKKNVPQVNFFQMDLRSLDFPENSFDGLWVCMSFLHVPKKQGLATLQGFYKVLKSNGLLHISVKEGNEELFIASKSCDNAQRFFANYSLPELKLVVEKAGFKIINEMTLQHVNDKTNVFHLFARKI